MELSTEGGEISQDYTWEATGIAEYLWFAAQQRHGGPPGPASPADRCRLPLWVPTYRLPYPRGPTRTRRRLAAEPGLQLRPWHLWPLRGTVGPRMARRGPGVGDAGLRLPGGLRVCCCGAGAALAATSAVSCNLRARKSTVPPLPELPIQPCWQFGGLQGLCPAPHKLRAARCDKGAGLGGPIRLQGYQAAKGA